MSRRDGRSLCGATVWQVASLADSTSRCPVWFPARSGAERGRRSTRRPAPDGARFADVRGGARPRHVWRPAIGPAPRMAGHQRPGWLCLRDGRRTRHAGVPRPARGGPVAARRPDHAGRRPGRMGDGRWTASRAPCPRVRRRHDRPAWLSPAAVGPPRGDAPGLYVRGRRRSDREANLDGRRREHDLCPLLECWRGPADRARADAADDLPRSPRARPRSRRHPGRAVADPHPGRLVRAGRPVVPGLPPSRGDGPRPRRSLRPVGGGRSAVRRGCGASRDPDPHRRARRAHDTRGRPRRGSRKGGSPARSGRRRGVVGDSSAISCWPPTSSSSGATSRSRTGSNVAGRSSPAIPGSTTGAGTR